MRTSMHRTLLSLGSGALVVGALTACGGSTSVTTNDQSPGDVKISSSDGSLSSNSKLPDGWPSDVPTPQGLAVINGTTINTGKGDTYSATFQGSDATPEQVGVQLTTDFKANGWKSSTTLGGGSAGGIQTWSKGTRSVQVTITPSDGKTGVNITVVDSGS
ncbi:MAG: hypothetical protein ACOYD0_10525 [Candidatus Nanopelagicales bacterium]